MTSASLQLYPASLPCPVSAIDVRLSRGDDALNIDYVLTGELAAVSFPARRSAPCTEITDGLWQHTCLELFVAARPLTSTEPPADTAPISRDSLAGQQTAYREFNFSPSGEWAMYDFTAYRERAFQPSPCARPLISVSRANDAATCSVCLPAALLPSGPLIAGVTAVVEDLGGDKYYWALSHPGQQPDFHLASSFTLAVPYLSDSHL